MSETFNKKTGKAKAKAIARRDRRIRNRLNKNNNVGINKIGFEGSFIKGGVENKKFGFETLHISQTFALKDLAVDEYVYDCELIKEDITSVNRFFLTPLELLLDIHVCLDFVSDNKLYYPERERVLLTDARDKILDTGSTYAVIIENLFYINMLKNEFEARSNPMGVPSWDGVIKSVPEDVLQYAEKANYFYSHDESYLKDERLNSIPYVVDKSLLPKGCVSALVNIILSIILVAVIIASIKTFFGD